MRCVHDIEMDVWVVAYMRAFAQEVVRRSALEEESLIVWAARQITPKDANLKAIFSDSSKHSALFFELVRTKGAQLTVPLLRVTFGPYLRAHSQKGWGMVHLSLPSVVAWFATHGWQMDVCEACLFVSRCA